MSLYVEQILTLDFFCSLFVCRLTSMYMSSRLNLDRTTACKTWVSSNCECINRAHNFRLYYNSINCFVYIFKPLSLKILSEKKTPSLCLVNFFFCFLKCYTFPTLDFTASLGYYYPLVKKGELSKIFFFKPKLLLPEILSSFKFIEFSKDL